MDGCHGVFHWWTANSSLKYYYGKSSNIRRITEEEPSEARTADQAPLLHRSANPGWTRSHSSMVVLPPWLSGNNQAPEPGVRRRDPPVLESRLRHGHNRKERPETARGKMAAPPTRRLCGTLAANSQARGSRSISISEQRAPGLAAVRIDRCIPVGTISIDASQLAL